MNGAPQTWTTKETDIEGRVYRSTEPFCTEEVLYRNWWSDFDVCKGDMRGRESTTDKVVSWYIKETNSGQDEVFLHSKRFRPLTSSDRTSGHIEVVNFVRDRVFPTIFYQPLTFYLQRQNRKHDPVERERSNPSFRVSLQRYRTN